VVRATAGLGDLVEARARLNLGPGASIQVAAMLGLAPVRPRSAATEDGPPAPRSPDRIAAERAGSVAPPAPPPDAAAPPIRRLRPVARQPWTTATAGSAVDPLPPVTVTALVPRLLHIPLLPRRTAHDVLDAVASTWQPTAALDTRRVLRTLAAGRPLDELYRLRRPSFAAGLHVLVDHGESMQPFRRDQREVVTALRRLVGSALVVHRFLDDPWAGTRPEPRGDWTSELALPAMGRPVLVLGTLGRGPLARPELDRAWLRLAGVLAGRGSALAALVPARRPTHPHGLRVAMDVVPWDPVAWRPAVARVRARRGGG
jgi:hypothetical protein